MKYNCDICSREINTKNSVLCEDKIFCSEFCRKEGLDNYRHKSIECLECGNLFFPKQRNSKFCSSSCSAIYNNKRRIRKKKEKKIIRNKKERLPKIKKVRLLKILKNLKNLKFKLMI